MSSSSNMLMVSVRNNEQHVVLVDRLLFVEDLPEVTSEEIKKDFPGVLNVVDFSYDDDCPR